MNTEIINKIKTKMAGELHSSQLIKLEKVLYEVFSENNTIENTPKDNKSLIKKFISAKK